MRECRGVLSSHLYFYNPITAFLSFFMGESLCSKLARKQIRCTEMLGKRRKKKLDYSMTLSRAANLSNEYWINEWTLKSVDFLKKRPLFRAWRAHQLTLIKRWGGKKSYIFIHESGEARRRRHMCKSSWINDILPMKVSSDYLGSWAPKNWPYQQKNPRENRAEPSSKTSRSYPQKILAQHKRVLLNWIGAQKLSRVFPKERKNPVPSFFVRQLFREESLGTKDGDYCPNLGWI